MMNLLKKVNFAMAFHCYQPVDNFGWTIEEAYQKSYLPLLETLEDFPGVKATFHYSGNMLEWFEKHHPEYIHKISSLIDKGQIELIGGGYCEPVMALIPDHDRIGQIRMNTDIMHRIFGVKPKGVWIAEKVWSPELVDTLANADIKYTIVDDNHLLLSDIKENEVFAPHMASTEKNKVVLFPSLTKLRYYMPFRLPRATIDFIKEKADSSNNQNPCFFFADDGEKFGLWPHTYKWVHKKGWLRKFFESLDENKNWLNCVTYSEVLKSADTGKATDVPFSSYREMMEWSGGDFRNFLKKYPEAGRMHNRMLSLSKELYEAEPLKDKEEKEKSNTLKKAKKELFKAQSNCAYWHGIFGGLYLPHLRSGVYKHLIKAQSILDGLKKRKTEAIRAIEYKAKDEKSETIIKNRCLDVFIKPSDGGIVSELDFKPKNLNLTNIVSRVKEEYHEKLTRSYKFRMLMARRALLKGESVNIHDVLGVTERGLKKLLNYDNYKRALFVTHILEEEDSWNNLDKGISGNERFLKGNYSGIIEESKKEIIYRLYKRGKVFSSNNRSVDLEVIKKIIVGEGEEIDFYQKIKQHSNEEFLLKHATEFNLSVFDDKLSPRPRLSRTKKIELKDEYSSLKIDLTMDKDMIVYSYPVFTVNESESGLGRIYQGLSVIIAEERKLFRNKKESEIKVKIEIKK